MHQLIQQMVDGMVLVMASILGLFMLALIAVHFMTTTDQRIVQRMKQRILRMISTNAHIEYLKGRVYSLLDPEGEVVSLDQIPGVRTRRGVQVLELVSKELSPAQAEVLRLAVASPWYSAYMGRKLASRDRDTAILVTKLIAELNVPGYTRQIVRNLYRWPAHAEAQEIGLLALFVQGRGGELEALFADASFQLILSFRTLQELFHCYRGDRARLYGALMNSARDEYVRRACIRGIGLDGLSQLSPLVLPALFSPRLNLQVDAVRTLGRIGCAQAADRIRELTGSDSWELRSACVDALVLLKPEDCYETLLRCLCDREWWVRFHAAEALIKQPRRDRLVADVTATGDQYAFEMLRFMLEREALLKGGDAA